MDERVCYVLPPLDSDTLISKIRAPVHLLIFSMPPGPFHARAAGHDPASVMCVRERNMIFFVLIHIMKTDNTTPHAAQIHEYPGRYCVHGCATERECCAPLCSRDSSLFWRRVCSAGACAIVSLPLRRRRRVPGFQGFQGVSGTCAAGCRLKARCARVVSPGQSRRAALF